MSVFLDLSTELPPTLAGTYQREKERAVKSVVVQEAVEKKIATEKELVVRDIMPSTDLGYTNEHWSKSVTASANSWATLIDKTLDDDEYITFTGILLHDPGPDQKITFVRFKLGTATVKAVFSLTKAYVSDYPYIPFKTPIRYKPKERILIEIYTTQANPTVKLEFLGFKVERIGEVVGQQLKE